MIAVAHWHRQLIGAPHNHHQRGPPPALQARAHWPHCKMTARTAHAVGPSPQPKCPIPPCCTLPAAGSYRCFPQDTQAGGVQCTATWAAGHDHRRQCLRMLQQHVRDIKHTHDSSATTHAHTHATHTVAPLALDSHHFANKVFPPKMATAPQLSDREAEVYDRQIRLWGVGAQRRMRDARVLVVGLTASAAEVGACGGAPRRASYPLKVWGSSVVPCSCPASL